MVYTVCPIELNINAAAATCLFLRRVRQFGPFHIACTCKLLSNSNTKVDHITSELSHSIHTKKVLVSLSFGHFTYLVVMYSSKSGDTYQGIPVSQAPPQQVHQVGARSDAPWSTGLCECFSDCNSCCLTCWCPCITFGRIAEIVDRGSSSCGISGALYTLIACVTGCPCFYSCFYRTKMRQQYMLHESPCGDCLIHCCCEACALCQEYRELKHRGFDMSIGWHGNIERQNKGVAMAPMAPVVEGGMIR